MAQVMRPGTAVSVEVPASSGNVGPGFDSVGLALEYYDVVRVEIAESGFDFDLQGEGKDSVPRTGDHLLIRALYAAWETAGVDDLPGVRLKTHNRIPHGRGMGSSASCVVAGVLAANALLPEQSRLDDDQVLRLCARLEGHPDNVAPSLYGGLTVSWGEPGQWRSAKVNVHPDVIAVVAIPDYEVSTAMARSLLPQQVPHGVASVNAGRAALLVEALSRNPQVLFPATYDGLHQPFRAPAMVPSSELMTHLRDRGYAALISGAGPTVLTLVASREDADQVQADIQRFVGGMDSQGEHVTWRVLQLGVPTEGAKVITHS